MECFLNTVQSATDKTGESMDESEQVLQQTTILLPMFQEEVPVLAMRDGVRYIPVIALCRMLGLRAETHIPRWRRLVLWSHARILPFWTSKGVRRVVWCLHLGALPLLCSCFNWQLVSPERRVQLYQAADVWKKLLDQAHQEMLGTYRTTRRFLFLFLTTIVDRDSAVRERLRQVQPLLDRESRLQLDILLEQGRTCMQEATAHARAMIHEQGERPIIDACTIDQTALMSETFSLPLLSVIPEQGRVQFSSHIEMLVQWYQDVEAFLEAHGM